MELHTRDMQVTGIIAINPDKVRVTLGEVQQSGQGPGAGMATGGAFSYDVAKEDAPLVWDIVTISVSSKA